MQDSTSQGGLNGVPERMRKLIADNLEKRDKDENRVTDEGQTPRLTAFNLAKHRNET
jgi:hypothetical protein